MVAAAQACGLVTRCFFFLTTSSRALHVKQVNFYSIWVPFISSPLGSVQQGNSRSKTCLCLGPKITLMRFLLYTVRDTNFVHPTVEATPWKIHGVHRVSPCSTECFFLYTEIHRDARWK